VPPEVEAHGIVFSGDVLYFRSPYCVVDLVKSGKWSATKIPRAMAVYLAYGNTEFSHLLLDLAVSGGLLLASDGVVEAALRLIRQRSGQTERARRRVLRRVKRYLGLLGAGDHLDHDVYY